jgi:regulator of protease activity HflC (stomatin/prohibitin superfamily)
MEKRLSPMSGYLTLGLAIVATIVAFVFFVITANNNQAVYAIVAAVLLLFAAFLFKGLVVINPNHSRICTFFGKYIGTVKDNGLLFINPFYSTIKLSLRLQNMEISKLKVNDKMGNPIEIAAVIVWGICDTYKASFEVSDYTQYINLQSEAAIRHLATTCPYDHMEDESATITLRDGGENVNEMLETELNERLAPAGITVKEARISHLAYAPEIAGAMLQRQQATAIVAARSKIVEGAVGMVEMALEQLSKKQIVHLDEERKAAMVSNLMVVLCGEKAAQPVLNTGTLYN